MKVDPPAKGPGRLFVEMLPQPDNSSCGATCLHAVYRFFGDSIELNDVVREVPQLEDGGTLAVWMGCHAMARGYSARIFTYNLRIFDPTWFTPKPQDLFEKLQLQHEHKTDPRIRLATQGYLNFLRRGGRISFEELTPALIKRYLKRHVPLLTGLSATYLYKSIREFGPQCVADDVRGEPVGHFVVLCDYDLDDRTVLLADPLWPNPMASGHHYRVDIHRLISAIFLGVITYDGNILVIEPRG